MTLKEKTISGLIWSFIDNIANLGIAFIVGIILARILSPKEFGLIGMLAIFIAISQSFIDSGFGQALVNFPHIEGYHLQNRKIYQLQPKLPNK